MASKKRKQRRERTAAATVKKLGQFTKDVQQDVPPDHPDYEWRMKDALAKDAKAERDNT